MHRRRPNQFRGVPNGTAPADDLFGYTQTSRAESVSVPAPIDDELWNVRTITAKTGLARSTIYAYIKQGLFPRQSRTRARPCRLASVGGSELDREPVIGKHELRTGLLVGSSVEVSSCHRILVPLPIGSGANRRKLDSRHETEIATARRENEAKLAGSSRP